MELEGLYVPLITPFTADGELAAGALERLAHEVLDAGAAGLVALGTTGEPATLTAAERRTVLDTCAGVCRERGAPLIAGAGTSDTAGSARELHELAERPSRASCLAAFLVPVPSFIRPSADGILAHFGALAAASPVPLIVYNIPYRTGVTLDWRTLRALAEVPGIIGLKHAVGGIDADTVRLMASLARDPVAGGSGGFAVLSGEDEFVSPLLALGATGGILAVGHLATAEFAALIAAWRAGDLVRARDLGHRLAPLAADAFAEPNPAVIKGVLHAQGRIPAPSVRLPLLPAAPESVQSALAALPGAAPAPSASPCGQR